MSKSKSTMTASEVLDVLTEKHFAKGAYEVLREVRDGTGAQSNRSADALVVSTWPSRGIWFGGVEVKVARNDWLKELANPAKSDAIQRFCSYWWIATPPDIVRAGELPETWGHIEVHPASAKVLVVAPKLEAQEPTAVFVASVMRSHSANQNRIRQAEHARGYTLAEERYKGDADTQAVRSSWEKAKDALWRAEQDLKELRDLVAVFERDAGVKITGWAASGAAEKFRALRRSAEALQDCDLIFWADKLRAAAANLQQTQQELTTAKKAEPEQGAA